MMVRHIPVLTREILSGLAVAPNKNFVDATVGDAGHAEKILEAIAPAGRILGLDADAESILRAQNFLYRFDERAHLVRANFRELGRVVAEEHFGPVHGVLFDLGWSTPQMEERGRGLTFSADEPLDMRFDAQQGETAAQLVSKSSFEELVRMLRQYGEEAAAERIAHALVDARRRTPITRTLQLAEIIVAAVGGRHGRLHPATRTFQALRIAVNDELVALRAALPQALQVLAPGGRIAVVSFHSLEDRIVKNFGRSRELTVITKRPVRPSREELLLNPRSRSAKLRIFEKHVTIPSKSSSRQTEENGPAPPHL